MAIDKEAVKYHIKGLLKALGDDPEREGLKETPDRVARMYEEIFEGMNYTNSQIAEMFSKTFEDDPANMEKKASPTRRARLEKKTSPIRKEEKKKNEHLPRIIWNLF